MISISSPKLKKIEYFLPLLILLLAAQKSLAWEIDTSSSFSTIAYQNYSDNAVLRLSYDCYYGVAPSSLEIDFTEVDEARKQQAKANLIVQIDGVDIYNTEYNTQAIYPRLTIPLDQSLLLRLKKGSSLWVYYDMPLNLYVGDDGRGDAKFSTGYNLDGSAKALNITEQKCAAILERKKSKAEENKKWWHW